MIVEAASKAGKNPRENGFAPPQHSSFIENKKKEAKAPEMNSLSRNPQQQAQPTFGQARIEKCVAKGGRPKLNKAKKFPPATWSAWPRKSFAGPLGLLLLRRPKNKKKVPRQPVKTSESNNT